MIFLAKLTEMGKNLRKFEHKEHNSAECSQNLKSRKLPEKSAIQKNYLIPHSMLDVFFNDTTHNSL